MDTRVLEHFKQKDPVLYRVIVQLTDVLHELVPVQSDDYFSDLCEAVINQQLSEKAGATIYSRFVSLFPDKTPDLKTLDILTDEQIRSVGMSRSKVRYIRALSDAFTSKKISINRYATLNDEEVIRDLTDIHGIGRWTAEMFLMFSLGRPDVFSYGDVGLRRAMEHIYALPSDSPKSIFESIVVKWAPYRTYASRVLWRSLDTKNIVQ